MLIKVQTRSGREIVAGGLNIPKEASVDDLKALIHTKSKKRELKGVKAVLYPERQAFNLPKKAGEKRGEVLRNGKKLGDYGITDNSVLEFKDLGIQIGYSTVFFWEYFGPMVIYPLFYYFPQYFYFGMKIPAGHSVAQELATYYWVFHYAKRIFETFFVHTFSHATMPIFNLLRNCGYYWGFAAMVSYFVNHPLYTAPEDKWVYIGLGFGLLCQASNMICHVILTRLRPKGVTTGYTIPRGFLFNYVTSANYTAEIYGWLGFNVATRSLMGVMFMLAGAFQMAQWAAQKHKRLRQLFDGKDGREKYPSRWVMLPPFF